MRRFRADAVCPLIYERRILQMLITATLDRIELHEARIKPFTAAVQQIVAML